MKSTKLLLTLLLISCIGFGQVTLTQYQIGVGNASNQLSGSNNLKYASGVLTMGSTTDNYLAFNNQAGTSYLQSDGNGQFVWWTPYNGTKKMTLTNSGNLLIGSTTDAGYKLDVNGIGRFVRGLNIGDFSSISSANYLTVFDTQHGSGMLAVGQPNYWTGMAVSPQTGAGQILWKNNTNLYKTMEFIGTGETKLMSIPNETIDPDKVLVSSAGIVKYMTKAQLGIASMTQPSTRVPYGTGTGLATDEKFTYDAVTNDLYLRSTPGFAHAGIFVGSAFNSTTSGLRLWHDGQSGVSYFESRIDGTAKFPLVINSGGQLTKIGGSLLVGTTTDAGYKLDVNGTVRIGSISFDPSGVNGVIFFNSSTNQFKGYRNGQWKNFLMEGDASSGSSNWSLTGSTIYNSNSGNVGIGTTDTKGYKFAVNGDAIFTKVKVKQYPWADYVFNDGYKLLTLEEVEEYIKKHKHLPEVPSAKEVEENGLDVGENQATLLKKIEELTLYIIEQDKKIEKLQLQNKELLDIRKELEFIKAKIQN